MSTKCSIEYSNKPEMDFHFYRECFEDDCVYLELRGKVAQFEAEPNRVMIRIPVEIWEIIRQKGIDD
jgi:hypothetical protein